MSTLYLIRHGNIPKAAGNPSISKLGIEQAKHTALYFQNKPITTIYCSPSNRTQETAQIIANVLKVKQVVSDSRLIGIPWWRNYGSLKKSV